MKISSFVLDVTPPVGARLAYGENRAVDSPIFIRGLLFDDGTMRAAVLACDYLYFWGRTWLEWRRAVAEELGAREEAIFLHSVHQHDSMRMTPPELGDYAGESAYIETTLQQLRQSVAQAAAPESWRQVRTVATAERRISGLASNRRLLDADGRCYAMRFSLCEQPELRALPVGKIDPLLRTIAFTGEDGALLAALHLYASHPMAAYHRNKVSADVPGVALGQARAGVDVFQLYLTGCAGNVTFGKYYTGDKEESLDLLGRRLGEGMLANLRHLEERTPVALSLKEASFKFPFNLEITEDLPEFRQAIRRAIAADLAQWETCSLYRLTLAEGVHLLSLPSEVCVEYQLYAQSLAPEAFVACAAYANGLYHYLPTAAMYEEGGYEPTATDATPEIEPLLKGAIAELLAPPLPERRPDEQAPAASEITEHFHRMLRYHRYADASAPEGAVIFIGDSITQGLSLAAVTPLGVNYGIGSDTTEGVLLRLPAYRSLERASTVVLAIGVNDLSRRSNEAILVNFQKIIAALPPGPRLLLSAILPLDESVSRRNRGCNAERIIPLNRALAALAQAEPQRITFLNAGPSLVDEVGNLRSEYHVGDGVHLSPEGYAIWISHLREALGG